MIKFSWNSEVGNWAGFCPRCGNQGFYAPEHSLNLGGKTIDNLRCAGGHAFVVEYAQNRRDVIASVYPIEYFGDTPSWLPEYFHNTFTELLFVYKQRKFRSVVALSGLLLEAHVTEEIPTAGDKKKKLFEKLQYLKNQGKIDQDQFSDATITRLTRNDVLHPKEILADVKEKDAEDAMNSVIAYLERAYKYRPSRALPSGDTSSPKSGNSSGK